MIAGATSASLTAVLVIGAAVVTGVFTWLAGSSAIKGARTLAGEERRQHRLYEAYVDLDIHIARWESVARDTKSGLDIGSTFLRPVEVEDPELGKRAEAVARLVGSVLTSAWIAIFDSRRSRFLSAFRDLDKTLKVSHEQDDPSITNATKALNNAADSLMESIGQLRERLRDELSAE
jgi:hypothetical protein